MRPPLSRSVLDVIRKPYIIALILLLGFIPIIFLYTQVAFTNQPFGINFTDKITGTILPYPMFEFNLTNRTPHPVAWSRYMVESPADTNLFMSAILDSNAAFGTLEPGASTNFPALIPHTKGMPFRLLVSYQVEPLGVKKLFAKILSLMGKDLSSSQVYTSQWFNATIDFRQPPFEPDGILTINSVAPHLQPENADSTEQ